MDCICGIFVGTVGSIILTAGKVHSFDELNLWGPCRISQGKVSPTISKDKLLLSFPLQMFEVVGGRRLILSDLVHLGQRLSPTLLS